MRLLLLAFIAVMTIGTVPSQGPLLAADAPKPLSVTFTYGLNGITRPDARFFAGENIFATAVVRGCQIPDNGICQFTMRYSVVDDSGKAIFTNANDMVVARLEAGATLVKLPLRCELTTLLEKGDYEFVLQLRDKKTREVYQSRQPITILPKNEFTISEFRFSADTKGTVLLGTTFETSQLFYLNWISYNLTAKEGRCSMEGNVRVLDSNQKMIDPPTEPTKADFPNVPSGMVKSLVNLTIENPGEYTVELTVKDVISGKTEVRSIPIRVVASLVDTLPTPAQ